MNFLCSGRSSEPDAQVLKLRILKGNSETRYSSRQGRLRIAQHFSAGHAAANLQKVPAGTLEFVQYDGFRRPYRDFNGRFAASPALKCWAILSRPYRDENR